MSEDIVHLIKENVIQGRVTADDEGMDEGMVGQPGVTELVEQALAEGISVADIINKGLTAWRLETLYNTRRMHFAVTDEHYVNSDANIPANEWHHVCGTYDGANIRLYIDGGQDTASPAAYSGGVATNTQNLLIGRYSGGWLMY